MKNLRFLIALVGLPASGKSTLANAVKKKMVEKFKINEDHISIIDPDLIRSITIENGLEFDYTVEPIIRKENLENIRKELEQKKIVISDDLNYYRSMRHDLKLITDSLDIPFFIVYLSTPLKICLEWNKKRGSTIPDEVIYKIKEKIDKFDRYNWDFPIYSVDLSVSKNLDEVSDEILNIIEINLNLLEESFQRLKIKKVGEKIENKKRELDVLTRKMVSEILKEQRIQFNGKEISNFRKQFINKNVNSDLSVSELINKFETLLRNRKIDKIK